MLAVAGVARSRFHTPPAMLHRILLAADPIVTCTDGRIRFESLSACCGVYARLDLLGGALDGEVLGRGTTNVDFGAEMRAALAGVDVGTLWLEIGLDEVEVRAGDRPGGRAARAAAVTLGPGAHRARGDPGGDDRALRPRAGRCRGACCVRSARGAGMKEAWLVSGRHAAYAWPTMPPRGASASAGRSGCGRSSA